MQHSKALHIIRATKGLTQQELAEITGYSRSLISRVESGERNLSKKTKRIIAKKLNIPPNLIDLLSLEEDGKLSDQAREIGELLLKILHETKEKELNGIDQSQFTFRDITNIYTVRNLARILGEKETELVEIATNANQFYRPFSMKETDKIRAIDNPTKELKHIQNKIYDRILKKASLPKEIYGGVEGRSIIDCAKVHLNKPAIVKLDIENCFPNTSSSQIQQTFIREFRYSKKVAVTLTKLTTFNGHVSIWVDDITISGKDPEIHLPHFLYLIKKYHYTVNTKKMKVLRNKKPQSVVGVGVNKKVGVPRKKLSSYKDELWEAIIHQNKTKDFDGKISHVKHLRRNQAKELIKLKNKIQK
jgi:transcriptional regulator with XRE-family HTH domain